MYRFIHTSYFAAAAGIVLTAFIATGMFHHRGVPVCSLLSPWTILALPPPPCGRCAFGARQEMKLHR